MYITFKQTLFLPYQLNYFGNMPHDEIVKSIDTKLNSQYTLLSSRISTNRLQKGKTGRWCQYVFVDIPPDLANKK